MKIEILRDIQYFEGGKIVVTFSRGSILDVERSEKHQYVVLAEGKERYVDKEGARILRRSAKPTTTITHQLNERPESDHYHTGSIDVWKFADENFSLEEVRGFHRIDAIKYLARYGKKKGFNRADLEKARVEIDKLLELHDLHHLGDGE